MLLGDLTRRSAHHLISPRPSESKRQLEVALWACQQWSRSRGGGSLSPRASGAGQRWEAEAPGPGLQTIIVNASPGRFPRTSDVARTFGRAIGLACLSKAAKRPRRHFSRRCGPPSSSRPLSPRWTTPGQPGAARRVGSIPTFGTRSFSAFIGCGREGRRPDRRW
jgi:hypothetical protein